MLRSKTYWFALALLATAGAASACTKADFAGPSQDQPAFEKSGGGN